MTIITSFRFRVFGPSHRRTSLRVCAFGKSMRTGKSHELVQTHASMYHPVFSTARSPSDGAVADVAVEPQSQTIELKPAPRPLALRSSFLPFKNSFLALPLNAVLRGMLYPSRAYADAISCTRASSTIARATFSHDQMVDAHSTSSLFMELLRARSDCI